MDLNNYYISLDIPAAREKIEIFLGDLALQEFCKIARSLIEDRLLLGYHLAARDWIGDRDLHKAALFQNLAAPIEKPEGGHSFQSCIRIRSHGSYSQPNVS